MAHSSNKQLGDRSVTDVVSDEENKRYILYTISVFSFIGIGFGLTGALGTRMLFEGTADPLMMGFFLITMFGIMILSGPILGAIGGLQVSNLVADKREAMITSFAGGAVGYVLMVILGVLVTTVFAPGADGDAGEGGDTSQLFDLGEVLVPLVVMAIPVGLVAAGMVFAKHRFLD